MAPTVGEYMKDKRALIVDASGTARASMAHSLVQIGIGPDSITQAANIEHGLLAIPEVRPVLILSEFQVGNKQGLDLVQLQRQYALDPRSSVFILITANTSQATVARAAEEDVDAYILKPFTPDILKAAIEKAILTKIQPPAYLQKIDEGKAKLATANFDEAKLIFEEAIKLDPAPALAHFYLGQTQMLKSSIVEAEKNYLKGLDLNKIHYKCLVGLYEVLMTQKRFPDAYEVVKKLSRYFPANPQRLTAVLRLAIMTKSYEDVEKYYQVFSTLDDRHEELIKYICAALVVCGKYYLQSDNQARALELFRKAATSAAGKTRLLREIIASLLDAKLSQDAREFLKRFPPESHAGNDFKVMDLLVMDRTDSATDVMDRARTLLDAHVEDPVLYKILIRRSLENGLKSSAENYAKQAAVLWPAMKDEFEATLK